MSGLEYHDGCGDWIKCLVVLDYNIYLFFNICHYFNGSIILYALNLNLTLIIIYVLILIKWVKLMDAFKIIVNKKF